MSILWPLLPPGMLCGSCAKARLDQRDAPTRRASSDAITCAGHALRHRRKQTVKGERPMCVPWSAALLVPLLGSVDGEHGAWPTGAASAMRGRHGSGMEAQGRLRSSFQLTINFRNNR